MTPALLPSFWETGRLFLRDATLEDVPVLLDAFNACSYVEAWDKTFAVIPAEVLIELVQKSLNPNPPDHIFKLQPISLKETHEILGYFHVYHANPHPAVVFVSMFVIHPRHQKHQYGQEVVEGLAQQCKKLGYREIWLEVFLKNWPALRFWIQQGFNHINMFDGDKVYGPDKYASLELVRPL